MANYARINIDTIGIPVYGNKFSFSVFFQAFPEITYTWTFVLTRSAPFQVTRSASATTSFINLYNAVKTDLGSSWNVTSLYNSDSIYPLSVEATNYSTTLIVNELPFGATASIIGEVQPPPSLIIDNIYASASSSDNNLNARFSFDVINEQPPFNITSPVVKNAATLNDLWFDYPRHVFPAQTININDINSSASIALPSVTTHRIDEVLISYTESGAIINIVSTQVVPNNVNIIYTGKEFSLDGINYQSSNIFFGLTPDTYTAYLRDTCNGLWTKEFIIESVTPGKPEPFFDISRSNSIHYVNSSLTNNYLSLFKNQPFTNIERFDYYQKLLKDNTYTTQFRTNYDNINIAVKNVENELVQMPSHVKVVENIGTIDKRDCFIQSSNDGYFYIYFTTGNIYDHVTDEIISTFNLETVRGTTLEPWMEEGILIEIEGTVSIDGSYIVDEIISVDDIGYAMRVNYPVTTPFFYSTKLTSTYNLEDWDVYEFDYTPPEIGIFNIEVSANDADGRYNDVLWISEPICVREEFRKSVQINYFTNSQTIQNLIPTGIINKIIIDGRFYKFGQNQNVDIFEDDNGKKTQLKRVSSVVITLQTSLIPPYLAEKLTNAIKHDEIEINGLKFTPFEDVGIDDKTDERNPFVSATIGLQLVDSESISDTSSIVSGSLANVLGASSAQVIGI